MLNFLDVSSRQSEQQMKRRKSQIMKSVEDYEIMGKLINSFFKRGLQTTPTQLHRNKQIKTTPTN